MIDIACVKLIDFALIAATKIVPFHFFNKNAMPEAEGLF